MGKWVVSERVTSNAQAGASTAASGTKNNYLTHKQYADYLAELEACKGDPKKEQEVKDRYKKISDEQTLKGDIGENSGEGFEWGIDLDENGDVKGFTVSGDLEAISNVRDKEIINFMVNDIDKSSWHDNELRMYTIGGNVEINKLLGGSVSIGYAVDKEGNVYKVVAGSIGASVNISDITTKDILKAVSTLTLNVNKQISPTTSLDKDGLRDFYSGLSFSLSKTTTGVQVVFSQGEGGYNPSYGVGNTINSVEFGVDYLRPVNWGI